MTQTPNDKILPSAPLRMMGGGFTIRILPGITAELLDISET